MSLPRRHFLTRVAAAGGASLVYEAMTGLPLLAQATRAPFGLQGRVSGTRVLILGSGLAGLTVAYELGKVGCDCRVLEGRVREIRHGRRRRVGDLYRHTAMACTHGRALNERGGPPEGGHDDGHPQG